MVELLCVGAVPAVAKQDGGGRTQVGEPDTKETGRPEGLPRTTAINMAGINKAPAMVGALAHLCVLESPKPGRAI